MNFVYNDGGRSKYFTAKNVGDCATRAIANATGLDYKLVYKALCKYAGKSVRNGCPKNADKKLLTELGWNWVATMHIGSGCQTHLDERDLPYGTIIVAVSAHLTCVKDHTIYDTYNCSRGGTRCVYGYWEKPKEWSIAKGTALLEAKLGKKKPSKAQKKAKPTKKPSKPKKRVRKAKRVLSVETRLKRLEAKVKALEQLLATK